ncbi:Plscr3, partial [Symbiodinium necroappetens]
SAPVDPPKAPRPSTTFCTPTDAGAPGFFLDVCCGANAPLSESLRKSGIQCICVDALGSEPLDLLDDKTYDSILRLAFSGTVRMAHAAPPCKEYSRLKLRPGGPRAVRSPDFLNGFPENTQSQQQRVEISQKIMYRSVCILHAVFASGGHASLEQPTNSMAWLEPFVQDFLSEVQATLSVVPACSVGMDVAKQWLFASSFAPVQQLAGTCSHQGQHQSVIGARDEQGHFLSQRTAEYPSALASRYSNIVSPLFEGYKLHECTSFCALSFALQCIPPDLLSRNGNNGFWKSTSLPDLPSTRFSDKHSTSQDWDFSVPPGQPYCLSALSRLSHLIADKDTSLFPALMQGVPTGFDKDIPRSHTLRPRRETDSDEGHELLICEGNWKGAEEDPALLQQLIEEELAAGYLEVIPDLETAFRHWGKER